MKIPMWDEKFFWWFCDLTISAIRPDGNRDQPSSSTTSAMVQLYIDLPAIYHYLYLAKSIIHNNKAKYSFL
jgi:hypothetical protein